MSHNGASFQFLNLTNYQVSSSPGFATWLAEQNVSVALTNTLNLIGFFSLAGDHEAN